MNETMEIVRSVINARIERLNLLHEQHIGDENIPIRISFRGKINMLEEILKDIEHQAKTLFP